MLPLAVGVSLAEAVEELVPTACVGLKWPNDLVVGGRKLGGVLCASRSNGEAAWVPVGFGINVGADPVLPPDDRTGRSRSAAWAGRAMPTRGSGRWLPGSWRGCTRRWPIHRAPGSTGRPEHPPAG